jgi:hypothetical protein
MIEIITHQVDMPELCKRRYQKELSMNLNKWIVKDTHTLQVVYRGKYEDATLACHNLNKRFYYTQSMS